MPEGSGQEKGLSRRNMMRGALLSAVLLNLNLPAEQRPTWESLSFVMHTHNQLYVTLDKQLAWFTAYQKKTIRSTSAVTSASQLVDSISKIVSDIVETTKEAQRSLKDLATAMLLARGERTSEVFAAAVRATKLVDDASAKRVWFEEQLNTFGSEVRKFDSMVNRNELET